MKQPKKLMKLRVTIEGYGYKKSNGEIALVATKPSRLLSIKEITESNKEKKEE